MTTLWDTTGTAVVRALAAERRVAGAVASGMALTLVAVVDEGDVAGAEAAATVAASAHPCRLLVVVRRDVASPTPRLDAEVLIGGRLGPGEAVVMRMYGRLGLHAESVVLPLLAPDAPVITWLFGAPPELLAHDPLAVLAGRRVTNVAHAPDPLVGLAQRARDYVPGDTDLAWARITPWRSALASALDSGAAAAQDVEVSGDGADPSAALLAAWLGTRLGCPSRVTPQRPRFGGGVAGVTVRLGSDPAASQDDGGADSAGRVVELLRDSERTGRLRRSGQPERLLPLPTPELGDTLAEELRRLDPDAVYAEALAAATGQQPPPAHRRVHIWRDPAERAAASS